MSLIKSIQRKARSIQRIACSTDIAEGIATLNKEWELEKYENHIREAFERGLITEVEFDRLLEEKEMELISTTRMKEGKKYRFNSNLVDFNERS